MAKYVFALVQAVHPHVTRLFYLSIGAGILLALATFTMHGLQAGLLLVLPALPAFFVTVLVVVVSSALLERRIPATLQPLKWAQYTSEDWATVGTSTQIATVARLLVGLIALMVLGATFTAIVWMGFRLPF